MAVEDDGHVLLGVRLDDVREEPLESSLDERAVLLVVDQRLDREDVPWERAARDDMEVWTHRIEFPAERCDFTIAEPILGLVEEEVVEEGNTKSFAALFRGPFVHELPGSRFVVVRD